MKPLRLEVITYAPTVYYHCQHCELTFQQMGIGDRSHRQQARESLPDDLREEFRVVSDWIHALVERYGERLEIRVVDAASLQGFWKSFRHRTGQYPFVVVDGRLAHTGTDLGSVEPVIERALQSTEAISAKGGGAVPSPR